MSVSVRATGRGLINVGGGCRPKCRGGDRSVSRATSSAKISFTLGSGKNQLVFLAMRMSAGASGVGALLNAKLSRISCKKKRCRFD